MLGVTERFQTKRQLYESLLMEGFSQSQISQITGVQIRAISQSLRSPKPRSNLPRRLTPKELQEAFSVAGYPDHAVNPPPRFRNMIEEIVKTSKEELDKRISVFNRLGFPTLSLESQREFYEKVYENFESPLASE